MKDRLMNEYFEWMCGLVCTDARKPSYRKLLIRLYDTPFTYSMPMDENRAKDGEDLRYRFGRERGISGPDVALCLDGRECSVLEMMLALAIRCEEHIMSDPDIGDRTGEWFWGMVTSLGLNGMTDRGFEREHVATVLHRFLNRTYKPNGEGGLFTVRRKTANMRSLEIWYQAMWYLDEILKAG